MLWYFLDECVTIVNVLYWLSEMLKFINRNGMGWGRLVCWDHRSNSISVVLISVSYFKYQILKEESSRVRLVTGWESSSIGQYIPLLLPWEEIILLIGSFSYICIYKYTCSTCSWEFSCFPILPKVFYVIWKLTQPYINGCSPKSYCSGSNRNNTITFSWLGCVWCSSLIECHCHRLHCLGSHVVLFWMLDWDVSIVREW